MELRPLSRSARTDLLKRIPLFSACREIELRRISSLVTELDVPAGRVLTLANRPGREFFVILSGSVTVWREGLELDVLGPGSFFGEIALLNRCSRTATVVADTAMELLVTATREFYSPHFCIPPVMAQMLSVMGARLDRTVRRLTDGADIEPSEPRRREIGQTLRRLEIRSSRDSSNDSFTAPGFRLGKWQL